MFLASSLPRVGRTPPLPIFSIMFKFMAVLLLEVWPTERLKSKPPIVKLGLVDVGDDVLSKTLVEPCMKVSLLCDLLDAIE